VSSGAKALSLRAIYVAAEAATHNDEFEDETKDKFKDKTEVEFKDKRRARPQPS
jgi:hypothetical protein